MVGVLYAIKFRHVIRLDQSSSESLNCHIKRTLHLLFQLLPIVTIVGNITYSNTLALEWNISPKKIYTKISVMQNANQ